MEGYWIALKIFQGKDINENNDKRLVLLMEKHDKWRDPRPSSIIIFFTSEEYVWSIAYEPSKKWGGVKENWCYKSWLVEQSSVEVVWTCGENGGEPVGEEKIGSDARDVKLKARPQMGWMDEDGCEKGIEWKKNVCGARRINECDRSE